nr:PREDICTED: TELO2-interacting protein 2-like [Megachile rotundata]
MNNLLKELEALKISGDFSEEGLWTACIDLVQRSYVPEKTVGTSRPCDEKDFREYRQVVDRNLRNIRSMLQHIIHSRNERNIQIDLNASTVKTFTINLLLLIGEQHEKNVWNTAESVSISKELVNEILELYRCQSISQLLMEQNNLTNVLLTLRPKLMKDTWKSYPAAVACYKWILYQTEKPTLYDHISDVLPTALIIIDDYVPENIVIGLECLYQIIQHSHLKKGLIDTGYDKVMFHTLERLTHQREVKYVLLVYSCITSLLATIEHWDDTLNVFEWTKRDDVLIVLLDNMDFEQNVELRSVYMLSLPQLLTNIGCAKWCEKLLRILCEYCEHHTDLKTLKATLDAAKTFLLMFHFRVAAHCVPLYTAFLKLHFDLTETPVFDKEIMQNLEDCICLLYKLSPNVGCAVMNDDRMRSVIKNSLQVVCLGDTKYFQ